MREVWLGGYREVTLQRKTRGVLGHGRRGRWVWLGGNLHFHWLFLLLSCLIFWGQRSVHWFITTWQNRQRLAQLPSRLALIGNSVVCVPLAVYLVHSLLRSASSGQLGECGLEWGQRNPLSSWVRKERIIEWKLCFLTWLHFDWADVRTKHTV